MDNVKEIFVYALIFIGLLAVIFVGGRYVQRLPSDTTKKINQISFGIAVASGILLYIFHYPIFLYLFLASIVSFFLFFNYKEEKT